MASANIIGSQVTITGLGHVSVNTKEVGQIRVAVRPQAALDEVSAAYHTHARGIRLKADNDGEVVVDGIYLLGVGFSLSSRGDKPAVFELASRRRPKQQATKFSGVLLESV